MIDHNHCNEEVYVLKYKMITLYPDLVPMPVNKIMQLQRQSVISSLDEGELEPGTRSIRHCSFLHIHFPNQAVHAFPFAPSYPLLQTQSVMAVLAAGESLFWA